MSPLNRRQIAWRAAQDLREGMIVNLGIGIPTLVADYLPTDREVILQSENGILGVGPAPPEAERDPDLINASKGPITLVPGGSFFSHTDSFLMIRGGHIDVAVLGGFQVSSGGDLANWRTLDDKFAPAVGGAMDLAVGAREVWVLMEHATKEGTARLLDRCTYPLTARSVVTRVYTSLAVIDVTPRGFVARALLAGIGAGDLSAMGGAAIEIDPEAATLVAPPL